MIKAGKLRVVSVLNAEHAPEALKVLDAQGSMPVANTPEAFRKRLTGESARRKKSSRKKASRLKEAADAQPHCPTAPQPDGPTGELSSD